MSDHAGFQFICNLDELDLNVIRKIDLDGREVCLVRTIAGVFAFGASCPHQSGPMCHGLIKGTMDPSDPNEYLFGRAGEIVTCPWHGYEFDLRDGASVGGALKGRLGAYPVEIRDDRVYCSPRRIRPPRPVRS